ncbi:MAG: hypothetical protein H0Z33_16355 [Bacillaceae bacterium]|nr:hypothetical protein [Bacillaceae bacterium]
MTVLIPGRTIRGTIRAVNPSAFKINRTMIPFASPFAIDQGFFEQEASRIEVLVKIKRIRKFNGFLVRRGLDFIEFEQDLPEDIARWIIPLNRFTRVICGDAKVEE